MFCSKCGKEIQENQSFCSSCGQEVGTSSQTPEVETVTSEPTPNKSSSNPAPVGFILGLVSIVAWILPLAGYPVTICGIVFSTKQLKSENKSARTMAITGLILSIVFLVFTLINSIAGVFLNLALMS